MNLLTQIMEDCQILNHVRTDDDFGGNEYTWANGAKFKAAIAKTSSPESVTADKKGISETYTVVVEESFPLAYHDVFKRIRDNAIFRVTSSTTDSTAHPASTVKIAAVSAERWELPA